MPFTSPDRFSPLGFEVVARSLMQRDGLPLSAILRGSRFKKVFDRFGVSFGDEPDAVYTPALVLWALVSQVFHAAEQRSCKAAVARVAMLWAALGKRVISTNTGAYCRARAKVPAEAIAEMAMDVAEAAEQEVQTVGRLTLDIDGEPADLLNHLQATPTPGRIVLVDGTTITAADTPENQEAYPQNPAQQEGLGFPILRCVALTSLRTGMILGWAFGPYCGKETGEAALLRQLLGRLKPGDILVADSYYCSYWLLAECRHRGIELVAKNHHRRSDDPDDARWLNRDECLVTWTRPARPKWMSEEAYARQPEALTLRFVKVDVTDENARPTRFTVATTILEPETYSAGWVRSLYQSRWLIELDIRAVKCNLGMDVLRSKTPAMVRTEMLSCVLANNLIRGKMLQAAVTTRRDPRTMSVTTTMQMLSAGWVACAMTGVTREIAALGQTLPLSERVGHRPGRQEPRANKRRPKCLLLMTEPRRRTPTPSPPRLNAART